MIDGLFSCRKLSVVSHIEYSSAQECVSMDGGTFPVRKDSAIFKTLPCLGFPGPFHLCFSYLQHIAFISPILNHIKLTEVGGEELCMDGYVL